MPKHKHYDLIVKWATDPERYQVVCEGVPIYYPVWNTHADYSLVDNYSGVGYEAIEAMINLLHKTADDIKRISKESKPQKILWIRGEEYKAYKDQNSNCGNGSCFFSFNECVDDSTVCSTECSSVFNNEYYFVKK